MVSMTPGPSPKDKIEKLRRTGDPRASEAAKKLIREITRGPDLARELAAQAVHDPDLAGWRVATTLRVVDEYVALRVLFGDWPAEIPHDVLGLTYTRHWRLLSTDQIQSGSTYTFWVDKYDWFKKNYYVLARAKAPSQ
jgi:hypothetical protein